MADATTVSVLIRARDEASAAFKNVESNAGKMAAGIAKHRAAIGKAALGIGAAIVGIGVLSVKSSLDQQKGIDSLDIALKNVGTSYDSSKKKIEELVAAQQNKTNFGDEEQRKALQELVQVSGSYDDAMAAMIPTMDLAAAKDMDLAGAATLVARAISGEATALGRYGIKLDNTAGPQEVMNTLLAKFGGQAEANADPLTQLGNRMGDLAQVIGDILLPIIEDVLPKVEALARKWIEWAEAHPELSKWIVIVTSGIGLLLIPLGTLLLMLPMLAAGFALVSAAIWPITAVVIAVTVAIAATVLIWRNWEKMGTAMKVILFLLFPPIVGLIALIKNWDKILLFLKLTFAKVGLAINELWLVMQKLWLGYQRLTGASDEQVKGMEKNIKKTQDSIKSSKHFILVTELQAKIVKTAADETADAVEDSSNSIIGSNEASGDSSKIMADVVVDANGKIIESEEKKSERIAEELVKTESLEKRITQGRRDAFEERRDIMLAELREGLAASKSAQEAREANIRATIKSLSEEEQAWKAAGVTRETALQTWAQGLETTVAEAGNQLMIWGIDLDDAALNTSEFERRLSMSFGQIHQSVKESMEAATISVQDETDKQVEYVRQGAVEMQESVAGMSIPQLEQKIEESGLAVADRKIVEKELAKREARVQEIVDMFRRGTAGVANQEDLISEMQEIMEKTDAEKKVDKQYKEMSAYAINRASDTVRNVMDYWSKTDSDKGYIREKAASFAQQQIPGSDLEKAYRAMVVTGKVPGVEASGSTFKLKTAAMGGPASGLTLVGERGPELVSLPGGSFVHPSGTGPGGQTNNFIFNGAVYGVEDLKEVVVEAVRDHAISGGFSGVFQEA